MGKSEEMRAWIAGLKTGDKVIQQTYNRISVLTVKKVTPTGIVRTTNGESFAQRSWCSLICGRGETRGEILPATPELIAEAERQDAERTERQKRESTIRRAKNYARQLFYNDIELTYELATEFLELLERHKENRDAE